MSAAELGSLSLEFTRLAQITGNAKYFDAVQRVTNALAAQQNETSIPGLFPIEVNANSMDFRAGHYFSFGSLSDSLYEYLPKEYLMLGGLDRQYQEMYESALQAAKKHLFFRPLTAQDNDILISGDAYYLVTGRIKHLPVTQHLTCFVGGMVLLAAKIFGRPEDLDIGRKLVEGCVYSYALMPGGIMPAQMQMVACDNAEDCSWSDSKWYAEINKAHMKLEGPTPKSLTDRALRLIKQHNLPTGVAAIDRGSYWLRYAPRPLLYS
jgi:mannosyl-oligosaccharide alpha-1,2-mannosidase